APRPEVLGKQLERLPEAQLIDGRLDLHLGLADAFQAQIVGHLVGKATALGADATIEIAKHGEELVQIVAEIAPLLNQLLLLILQQLEHAAQQRQLAARIAVDVAAVSAAPGGVAAQPGALALQRVDK